MLGLVAASIWSWAIIINKSIALTRTDKRMDAFEDTFWSGQSLDELYREHRQQDRMMASPPCSSSAMTRMAARFRRLGPRLCQPSDPHRQGAGCVHLARGGTARIQTAGARHHRLGRRLISGCSARCSGIMTTFRSIAASKNTSLAVVAPGIAEALFATAIALVGRHSGQYFLQQIRARRRKDAGPP